MHEPNTQHSSADIWTMDRVLASFNQSVAQPATYKEGRFMQCIIVFLIFCEFVSLPKSHIAAIVTKKSKVTITLYKMVGISLNN